MAESRFKTLKFIVIGSERSGRTALVRKYTDPVCNSVRVSMF